MGAFKQANKILLVAVAVALVLVIAAIIILAVTLGKTNNLNTIAPTNPPAPTPQVAPYYFTVTSLNVSYSDANDDYAAAVKKLIAQITGVLQSSNSSRAIESLIYQNIDMDAISNFTQPYIIGISPGSFGAGVTVMASTVFSGSNVPTLQTVTALLNTNGLQALQVSDGTMNQNMNNQMCSQVYNANASSTAAPPTTQPPSTTSTAATATTPSNAPPTSSSSISPASTPSGTPTSAQTTVSAPITTTTSPAASTSTAAAGTTTMPVTGPTTAQPPCTPPPTSVPTLPCQANFALLIDTSNGTTAAQFAQQQQFIAHALFQAGWTYSQWAIANYDSTFQIDIPYASLNSLGEAQGAVQQGIFQSTQTANIANALQKTVKGFNDVGAQPCLQQKTILFTSTSDPTDVTNAIQWAEHVQALGDLIVIGMGPNVDMTSLTRLASPNSAFNWPDYNNPPANLAANIAGAFQCSFSSTPATPPPTSPAPSTSSTATPPMVTSTTTTGTGSTPSPCMLDIVLLIDSSNGLGSQTNFQAVLTFVASTLITNWNVGLTSQVEVDLVLYDDRDFLQFGAFTFGSTAEVQNAINTGILAQGFFLDDPPSIFNGLNSERVVTGQRPGATQVTVLFTSTSNQTDINRAVPIATQLKNNGTVIIVVGIGPNVDLTAVTPIATPGFVFGSSNYGTLTNDVVLANNINTAAGTTTCAPLSSTTPGATGTTVPTTPPAATTSTPSPTGPTGDPCRRDIIILMDTSNGLGTLANFQAEVSFVATTLITNWNVAPTHVEADPILYDDGNFLQFGTFVYQSTAEMQDAINSGIIAQGFFLNDAPSILNGLRSVHVVTGQRMDVTQVAILFSSTSNQTDINLALPFAAQLKNNGTMIIVVAIGPNANLAALTPLSSGAGYAFSATDYTSLATNAALAGQINTAIGICGVAQSTSAQPPATTTATPPMSPSTGTTPNPCTKDIYLLMDTSSGLGLLANFQAQLRFIAFWLITNWNVSPTTVEVGAYLYDSVTAQALTDFNISSTIALRNDINSANSFYYQHSPSISKGLSTVAQYNGSGPRNGVKQYTLLFTSTSNAADIAQAKTYSDQLKARGNVVIVIGIGPNVDISLLTTLASRQSDVFLSNDYTALANDAVLGTHINQALDICVGSTTSGTATSPAASTSTAAAGTTTMPVTGPTTAQPPCTPPPTSVPTLPCQANFALLIDTSNGTTAAQFAQQQQFIAHALFQAGWTYSQWAIANYDSTFQIDIPYASLNSLGEAQGAVQQGIFQSTQTANIANALQKTVKGFNDVGAQPCLQQKTILFTSTSDPTDVQNAIQWAEHVQALGDLIVVGMGPNVDMTSLTRLASPNSTFNWPDYTAPPPDLATHIIGAFQC